MVYKRLMAALSEALTKTRFARLSRAFRDMRSPYVVIPYYLLQNNPLWTHMMWSCVFISILGHENASNINASAAIASV